MARWDDPYTIHANFPIVPAKGDIINLCKSVPEKDVKDLMKWCGTGLSVFVVTNRWIWDDTDKTIIIKCYPATKKYEKIIKKQLKTYW